MRDQLADYPSRLAAAASITDQQRRTITKRIELLSTILHTTFSPCWRCKMLIRRFSDIARSSLAIIAATTLAITCESSASATPPSSKLIKDRGQLATKNDAKQENQTEAVAIASGGLKREAFVLAPRSTYGSRPAVIVLHGGTRGANDIFKWTSWPKLAEREKFLLVAPQGVNNQWNDGRDVTISGTRSTADDVGFLSSLIETLIRDYGADPRAIFVTGVSNGGLMSMRLGCEKPSLVGAIAAVISTMPEVIAQMCRSARPLPAMFMAGTADPLMPYDGKPNAFLLGRGNNTPMLSIPATLDLWRARNGCTVKGVAKNLPNLNKNDRSTVTRIEYRTCKSGAPVIHYRVNDGGHREPSMPPQEIRGRFAQLGPQNGDIDGPEEIWHFFTMQIDR